MTFSGEYVGSTSQNGCGSGVEPRDIVNCNDVDKWGSAGQSGEGAGVEGSREEPTVEYVEDVEAEK